MHASSLNHTYRVVWNATTGVWQAVSEITASQGKTKGGKAARALSAALLGAGLSSAMAQQAPPTPPALPAGGQVVAGQAALNQSGSTLTITQASARAAIDWKSFNVGAGHSVNFVQPNAQAVALNRVLGSDVSVIQGAIKANGQVFLVNPNGVLFTPTAQVNVGGLVASTQHISTADFMAGQYRFSGTSEAGITNQGHISAAEGGTVALIAARIVNSGQIQAPQGQVLLGAGRTVTLDLGGPVKIVVNEGALQALIEQGGGIRADGGLVYLTAKAASDLASAAINHTGITQAQTLATGAQGQIILLADMAQGTTKVAGTLDASAPNGGHGGFIETSGAQVDLSQPRRVTTHATQGQTGTWLIDPNDFTIAATGGNITGVQLGSDLGSNNITISTATQGTAGGNGDIFVKDNVTWSSGNTLTLNAERHIRVLAALDASQGSGGKVALLYGQGSANGTINGTAATYDFGLTDAGFTGKINLQAGDHFSTKLGNNGTLTPYKVITALGTHVSTTGTDLQGMTAGGGGNFVLGADIDATATNTWDSGKGFSPLQHGNAVINLDGLGHTINQLNINRPEQNNVGLFAGVQSTPPSTIKNLGLVGGSVTGKSIVGSLAGAASGARLSNVYSTMAVNAGADAQNGLLASYAGGLIGSLSNGASLTGAFAKGNVTGADRAVGGLVGFASSNTSISKAYATGAVTSGNSVAGGLVGLSSANISSSYATGAVAAGSIVGGLVGQIEAGTITNVYATGSATGNAYIGGLFGAGFGGNITYSYASGAVKGSSRVGGIQGDRSSTVSYASVFFDAEKTGQSLGTGTEGGAGQSSGIKGLSTNEMGKPFNFIDAGWDFATVWGKSTAGANSGAPMLRSLSTGLFDDYVKITDTSKTYGEANSTITIATLRGPSVANANLTVNWDAAIAQGSNAGDYVYSSIPAAVVVAPKSDQRSLYVDAFGKLTINKRALQVNANDFLASATATASVTGTAGLYGTDSVSGVAVNDNALSVNFGHGTLANNYATTVVVQGASGADVNVNRALSLNGLSLTVQSDKNIHFKNTVTAQGATDKVNLVYGQGAVAAGNTASYNFELTDAGFASKLNLQAGNNFSTKLGSDGALTPYTVITSLGAYASTTGTDLQGIRGVTRTSGLLAGKYVMGADIDASATSGWASSNGFLTLSFPLVAGGRFGGPQMPFSGVFDGLGHVVSNLTSNPSTFVAGVFGINSGTIRNVGMVNATVEGTGNTTAAGILAAENNGTIAHVYTTGSVKGGVNVGGLVGKNTGTIVNAFSTATVSSNAATPNASTNKNFGGLVGEHASGSISQAFATGAVNGVTHVGGLVGSSAGTLTNTYARGSVTGGDLVGGLVGTNSSTISHAYATGAVSGTGNAGYLLGGNTGTVTAAFWNNESTGLTNPLVAGDGKTTAELQNPFTFIDAGWDFGKAWGKSTTAANNGLPMLRTLSTGLYDYYAVAASTSKTYGDANPTLTVSKLVGVSAATTTDLSVGSAIAQKTNVGDYDFSAANVLSVTNSTGRVYAVGKLTINQKTITVSGITAADKAYDGTKTATVDTTKAVYNGLVDGDALSTTATGEFADKNASNSAKTVNLTATTSAGVNTSLGNYKVTEQASTTANITPKAVTTSGIKAANKVYDGDTTAVLDETGFIAAGVVGDERITLGEFMGVFADKNVGTGKTVTLIGGYNAGADTNLNNYSITGQASTTANITPKALSISGSSVANKTYDGSTMASVTVGTLSGLVGDETLGTTTATGTFANKDAGANKDASVTYTLTNGAASFTAGAPIFDGSGNITGSTPMEVPGAKASNYSLAGETLKADIAKKALTVSGFAASSKTYDGNNTATITNAGSLQGVIDADTTKVALGNTGATFVDKNAATGKTVTLNGTSLSGDEAKNYSLAATAVTTTANITPKAVTTSGIKAANKVYDGDTNAVLDETGFIAVGLVGDERITLGEFMGVFADKNVGTGKTVTLIGGYNAGVDTNLNNYTITGQASTTANITPKALSISGSSVANKTYDGSTTASVTVGTLSGLVGDETLGTTTATGSFANKDAGANKDASVTYTLTNGAASFTAGAPIFDGSGNITGNTPMEVPGAKASNYSLAGETLKADIAKKALTVSGFTASGKTYDGNNTATITNAGSLQGVVTADVTKVALGNTGATFADKNAATGKTVTLNGTSLSGDEAKNYSLAAAAVTTTADISAKELTISGFVASNKTYDGNNTATINRAGSLQGVIDGDTTKVALGNTGATFADKNAATGKTVTLNGTSLSGTEATNYKLATAAVTTTADISAKELTVTGFASSSKTYDGSASATISKAGSLQGVIEADTTKVALGNTGATFADKNAAAGKTVTLNGMSLSGDEAANYKLAAAAVTTTADITAKELTVTGFAASSKTYDGSASATISKAGSLQGVIEADTTKVALGNTGATFADKNAATGKTVTLNGTSLSGTEAANYKLATAAVTTTADIAKKAVSVTATAASKVFDGNTSAPGVGEVGSLVGGDVVSQAGRQAFLDNLVGTNKPVRASGVAMADGSGSDMTANYAITYVDTNTGTIRQLAPDAVLAAAAQLAQTATLSLGGRSLQAAQSGSSNITAPGLNPALPPAAGVAGSPGAPATGEAPANSNPSSGLQFVTVPPGTFIDSGASAGILRIGVVNGGINLSAPR